MHPLSASPSIRAIAAAPLALSLLFCSPPPAHATDNDNDGIPLEWEEFRGLNDNNPADAAVDFDGDGLSCLMEYVTQGRPAGSYQLERFPMPAVPGVDFWWAHVFAANRAGEFLVNFYGSTPYGDNVTLSYLWTPLPGAPLAQNAVVPLNFELNGDAGFFNDEGEMLLPDLMTSGTGQIVRLRDYQNGGTPYSWNWNYGESIFGLCNNGGVLCEQLRNVAPFRYYDLQWDGQPGNNILTFGYQASQYLHLGRHTDPVSGAWILGYSQTSYNASPQAIAWRLPADGSSPLALPPLPAGAYSFGFQAASSSAAVAYVYAQSGASCSMICDASGWRVVTPPDPTASTYAYGVSDAGTAFAWSWGVAFEEFLWKEQPMKLMKVIPALAGGIYTEGVSDSGVLFGADYGTYPQQPILFLPSENSLGDGAADPLTTLPDADQDGIPDDEENTYGSNALLADTDGDGRADQWELATGSNPLNGYPAPPPPGNLATGLALHTPARHPLAAGNALP